MLLLAKVGFAQSARFPDAPLWEPPSIRLIGATEEMPAPVQPGSVYPRDPQPRFAEFDGSVSASYHASGESSPCASNCPCIGDWRDNTEVWFGFDSFRSRGDGIMLLGPFSPALGNSTGAVGGFNTAFALGDSPIRGQIGGSYGIYDWKGRWLPFSDASAEQQTFITFGLSKRSDICNGDPIAWGVVFDQMFDHQWGFLADEIYLTQFRLFGGYAINECNEVGVMATVHSQSDFAQGLVL